MLGKVNLEDLENPGLGYYTQLLVVQKVSGGWYAVIVRSYLNNYMTLTSFNMEIVSSVLGFKIGGSG